MSETIFSKIIDGEVKADIVYEDDQCLAFNDANPKAPMHVLVIPKQAIAMLSDTGPEDEPLLGHLLHVAVQVASQRGYGDAFRLAINNGARAGQSVFHLHVHVLGGRDFMWPPG